MVDPTRTSPPLDARHPAKPGVHGRFEPGTRLGTRYRIVGLLGRGGMGEVYRADDLELGQSVALKFLPERVVGDSLALDRFRNEVRTARQVAHPNVCRIYDIARQNGHVFLSMEYIDGEDLGGVLRRLGRPSSDKAIEIARQICLGVAAAHDKRVLHRDLKPANIMIDGRGQVRITDFGLAGFLDELGDTDGRAGTPAYMAPEQLAHGKVSVCSDIYTLGLILYELFTGQRVFDAGDVEVLARQHASGTVSMPSTISDDIDPAVEQVIMRCLEARPEDRPQSAYQVLAALPGGDPLAAALAAGETPSPELVANARDAGWLRPHSAAGLIATFVASVAVAYVYNAATIVMPERSPTVLAVVAEQTMAALGYGDLPRNSVSGYDINDTLATSLRTAPRPRDSVRSLEWPPKFRYWRRWSHGQFTAVDFHSPEEFSIDGAIAEPMDFATVALDSTGRLLDLRVTLQDRSREFGREVDWSPLFDLAHLDAGQATPISVIEQPVLNCDQVVAWHVVDPAGGTDPVVIQMGALGGRPNYFEILGAGPHAAAWPQGAAPKATPIVWRVFQLFIIILACRNLIASRGDRRSAFRCALIMGVLYTVLEVLAIRPGESGVDDQIGRLLDGQAAGHIILHAFDVWLLYMAFEPYVRRIWPHMLVGWIRLLTGRVRDPAVGREVVVGLVTGCGLLAVVGMLSFVHWRVQVDNTGQLPLAQSLRSMMSPVHYLSSRIHFAAWGMLDAIWCAGSLVVIRFVVRHSIATVLIATVWIGAQAYDWFALGPGSAWWLELAHAALFGTAIVLLYTRVGILSVIMALVVFRASTVFAIDYDTWFAPYAMADLAIVLALAAYGFWVAVAGQPILRDRLIAPYRKS